jgi:hypothetical protein
VPNATVTPYSTTTARVATPLAAAVCDGLEFSSRRNMPITCCFADDPLSWNCRHSVIRQALMHSQKLKGGSFVEPHSPQNFNVASSVDFLFS